MTSTYFAGGRVTIYSQKGLLKVKRNGGGQAIELSGDWNNLDHFFSSASTAIDMFPDAQRCFNEFGIEIVDVLEIQNGGIIYLASANEKFISPHENLRKEGEGTDIPSFFGQFTVGPVFCNGISNSQLTISTNAETGECVVMKWIPKTALSDFEIVKKIEAEAQSLTALSHACITKLQSRLDTPTHVVFIFDPWRGSNMKKYMSSRGSTAAKQTLPNDVAYGIITQVLSAVIHMHVKGVVHGEISLDNIFMKSEDSTEDILIGGFHHAVVRSTGETFTPISNNNMDNSYKAPEYYTQTPIKGPPLDMWAVGVVYFALLHGRFPFFGRSVSQGCPPAALKSLMFNVKTGGYEFDSHITREMKFAFQHLFIISPDTRPDATYASRLIQGGVPIPENYDEKQGLISTTISSLAMSKKQKNAQNSGGGSGGTSSSTLNTDTSSVSFLVKEKEENGDGDSDCSSVGSARSAPATAGEKTRAKSVKKTGGVGFFPSIGGSSSASSMISTSSSSGFLSKITGGLFGHKDDSKKGVAGGGGKDGGEPLLPMVNQDGMSSRLVNSTRIKVEEHIQKLQGMVTQTVEKSKELAAAGRKNKTIGGRTPVTKEKTNSRYLDGDNSINNSSHMSSGGGTAPTVAELQAAMNRNPYGDDERTVRQPKPIFKARNIPEIATGGGGASPVGDGSPFSPTNLSDAFQGGGLSTSTRAQESNLFDGGSTGMFLASPGGASPGGGGSSEGGFPSILNLTQKNSVGSNSIGTLSGYIRSDSNDIVGTVDIDTSRSRPMDTSRSINSYGASEHNTTIGASASASSSGMGDRGNGVGGTSQDNLALATPSPMNSASDRRMAAIEPPSPHSPLSSSSSIAVTAFPSLNNSIHGVVPLSSYIDDDGANNTATITANHSENATDDAATTTATQNASNISNSNSNTTNNNSNSGFTEDYSKYDDDGYEYDTQFGFGVGAAGKTSQSSKKLKKAGGGTGTSSSSSSSNTSGGAGKLANRTK